jgi:hypothetical protein
VRPFRSVVNFPRLVTDPDPPRDRGRPTRPRRLADRHDLATPLAVADAASARYGWPLHVIDEAGEDPVLDQPNTFLGALRAALAPAGNAADS